MLNQIISDPTIILEIIDSILMAILTALAVLYAKRSWKEQIRLEGKIVARDMLIKDINWDQPSIPVYVTIANIGEKAVENINIYVDNRFYAKIPFILAGEKVDYLVAKYSTTGHVTCWLDGTRMSPREGDGTDFRMPKIEVKDNSVYLIK